MDTNYNFILLSSQKIILIETKRIIEESEM